MHGEKVQRKIGECGLRAKRKSEEFDVEGELAADVPVLFGGGGRRVRCGRASHGAGRSRKIASAFGL
jgi:hypothetical protein